MGGSVQPDGATQTGTTEAGSSSGSMMSGSTSSGGADAARESASDSGSNGPDASKIADGSVGADGADGMANDGGSTMLFDVYVGDGGVCDGCGGGSVCVEDQTIGGAAVYPDDAGHCPAGRVMVPQAPNFCSPVPTFHCAALPAACNTPPGSVAVAHCVCASNLCQAGTMCSDLSPTLMECLLAAP